MHSIDLFIRILAEYTLSILLGVDRLCKTLYSVSLSLSYAHLGSDQKKSAGIC